MGGPAVIEIDPGWRPPTLSTERLILRSLTPDDAESLFRHASNPNVTRYASWDAHTSIDQSIRFVGEYAPSQYLQAIPEPIAICERGNVGEVIGVTGGIWADRNNFCMEIGFWVAEPYWNRGYVTEAARELVRYLFATYTVERVQAHCLVENRASARALEKIGLQFEGIARSAVFLRGRFWDIRKYAVLRSDWAGS
jgi:ribosomal-protein-alanine N-acetyltransferase